MEKCYEVFYPSCIVNNPQIIFTSCLVSKPLYNLSMLVFVQFVIITIENIEYYYYNEDISILKIFVSHNDKILKCFYSTKKKH